VIRSKEAAGREKDRLALPRLRRLRDVNYFFRQKQLSLLTGCSTA